MFMCLPFSFVFRICVCPQGDALQFNWHAAPTTPRHRPFVLTRLISFIYVLIALICCSVMYTHTSRIQQKNKAKQTRKFSENKKQPNNC